MELMEEGKVIEEVEDRITPLVGFGSTGMAGIRRVVGAEVDVDVEEEEEEGGGGSGVGVGVGDGAFAGTGVGAGV